MRPELLEQSRQRQNLRLNLFVEPEELRLELVANLDNPAHCSNMTYRTYAVNYI
jgi:hypothetical protein